MSLKRAKIIPAWNAMLVNIIYVLDPEGENAINPDDFDHKLEFILINLSDG
jgi:hypothetical protein